MNLANSLRGSHRAKDAKVRRMAAFSDGATAALASMTDNSGRSDEQLAIGIQALYVLTIHTESVVLGSLSALRIQFHWACVALAKVISPAHGATSPTSN